MASSLDFKAGQVIYAPIANLHQLQKFEYDCPYCLTRIAIDARDAEHKHLETHLGYTEQKPVYSCACCDYSTKSSKKYRDHMDGALHKEAESNFRDVIDEWPGLRKLLRGLHV